MKKGHSFEKLIELQYWASWTYIGNNTDLVDWKNIFGAILLPKTGFKNVQLFFFII